MEKEKYYEKNKTKIIPNVIRWQKNNKDKVAKYIKKYIKKNSNRINKYNANIKFEEYNTNENKKIKAIILAKHKFFLLGSENGIDKYVGLSLTEYKKYIEGLLPEGCSWLNYGTKWQIRRSIKINEIDLTIEKNIKKYLDYKNIYIYEINKIII